ncbi:MAG TPA: hypothetical protein VH817_01445 [Thermoleophilaceae bacterium]|jgi:hypothetical protein
MRRHLKSPSPSTTVALLALFVALGGTSYAAVKINGKSIRAKTITGNKLKNKTLTGGKLKGNTLTGKQIKESTLGSVPKAAVATSATTANGVAGGVAAGFVPSGKVLATDVIKLAATGTSAGTSPLKTVFTSGPFSLQAACWDAGAGMTEIRLLFTSTEAGSIVNNEQLPYDFSEPDTSRDPDDAAAAWAAPSGATLFSSVYYGIKTMGADCLVAVDGVATP